MEMNKYLGLLKWSLKYQDGTKDTEFTEMDKERQKWLKEAIEANTVDPAEQMKALISVLQVEREEEQSDEKEKEFVENKVHALQQLRDWVESIDWAMDLHKLGGLTTVVELTRDTNEEIRVNAMDVFATTVQNNPKCQAWATEMDVLKSLAANLEKEGCSETEQAKNVLAISCLVRDYSPASVSFIKDHKGIAKLVKLISSDDPAAAKPKGQIKAMFLLRYFINEVPAIKITLADTLASSLNATLLSQNFQIRENALHLLISIYSDAQAAQRVSESSTEAVKESLKLYEPGSGQHFNPPLEQDNLDLASSLLTAIKSPTIGSGPSEDILLLGN
jgi:hypothetical protein